MDKHGGPGKEDDQLVCTCAVVVLAGLAAGAYGLYLLIMWLANQTS
jgi:hypothetical protein